MTPEEAHRMEPPIAEGFRIYYPSVTPEEQFRGDRMAMAEDARRRALTPGEREAEDYINRRLDHAFLCGCQDKECSLR